MISADVLSLAYTKFIEAEERRGPQGPRTSVYASSWTPCTRQMTLDMLRPDIKPAFQADTLANFRRGKDRERDLIADLTRVGRHCDPPFELVGAQERFELRDKKGRVVIVGKVDTRIKFVGQKGSDPVEIKSFHPNLIQGVKRFEDMFQNRWLRRASFQTLAYLLGSNEERGWIFLDRPGIPRPLEVRLMDHLPLIEDFLQRAEVAMDARENYLDFKHETGEVLVQEVADRFLPPFTTDPAECRVCPFLGSACNPPMKFEGASLIVDESLLAAIDQHETLDEPRKEYKDLHEQLAETLAAMTPKEFKNGVKKQIVAGKFLIETTWQKSSTTDMDSLALEVLAALMVAKKTDDAGKFSFKVIRVTE